VTWDRIQQQNFVLTIVLILRFLFPEGLLISLLISWLPRSLVDWLLKGYTISPCLTFQNNENQWSERFLSNHCFSLDITQTCLHLSWTERAHSAGRWLPDCENESIKQNKHRPTCICAGTFVTGTHFHLFWCDCFVNPWWSSEFERATEWRPLTQQTRRVSPSLARS
jgi:hypothetical protein